MPHFQKPNKINPTDIEVELSSSNNSMSNSALDKSSPKQKRRTTNLKCRKSTVSQRLNHENLSIHEVFLPLVRMFKVCGIYTEFTRTIPGRLHIAWCLFMTIGIWADMGRYFTVFNENISLSGRLMGLLAQGSFLIMNTFVASANLYLYSKYLSTFLKEFDQYGAMYGYRFDVRNLQRLVRISLWCLVFLSTLGLFGMSSFILKLIHTKNKTFTELSINPFQTYPEKYQVILVIITLSWRFFGIEVFMQSCLLYFILTFSVYKEYSSITRKIGELISNDSDELPASIENIRLQHEAVTRVLMTGNRLIQGVAFAIYTCGIPMICVVIFGLVRGKFPLEDFVSLLGFLVCCTVGMIFNTAFGVTITTAAHSPLQHLFLIDTGALENKVFHQIELFTLRLQGPPIGISVYGLFVINKSVVLTLIGTIVTYSVVVLQLP